MIQTSFVLHDDANEERIIKKYLVRLILCATCSKRLPIYGQNLTKEIVYYRLKLISLNLQNLKVFKILTMKTT